MDANTTAPDMNAISTNETKEKRTPLIPYVMPTLKLSMLTLKASKIMDTHNHIGIPPLPYDMQFRTERGLSCHSTRIDFRGNVSPFLDIIPANDTAASQ
ncbi:hypothetical protein JCM14450A_23750 [Geobacillus stearothermophilus]